MNTYILATVGTSMPTNLRRECGLAEGELPDGRKAVDFLRRRDPLDRACGAEVNSIAHLLAGQKLSAGVVKPPAGITFLVSDTEEGKWVGEVLCSYFRLPDVEMAEAIVVRDLTGDDPGRFARRGLRNLVREAAGRLDHMHRRHPGAVRLIDATGGYKAQISFAGLIGQTLKVPVVYLFERFPHCIEMPPLPVHFDRDLWIEHYSVFKRLDEESYLPVEEVRLSGLPQQFLDLLDVETQEGSEFYALSPVLELMHQGFMIVEPAGLTPPPHSDLPAEMKLRINRSEMGHAPKGSQQRIEQLARLPYVTHVENVSFENTARSHVKTGGAQGVAEVFVVHSDGALGLKIRLRTTARDNPERQWCCERLKDAMAE